ncbi:hypothetical protein EC973_000688 [Apophysomyces ossiformis]|uniref:CLASP N-terminal domain-containing protein n=1 Tax=Apophysomyces ossiformis TaxID=679940 RepID=A0A8H7ETK8_9FUNG|nr:hypothetical protein EC973_000688 [Apophysomyces ossiformis]
MTNWDAYPKKPIRISSKSDLDKEMKRALQLFKQKETEETWEQFNQALKNVTMWTLEDNAHVYEGFVDHIRSLQKPIIKALATERTRLSGTATDLLKGLSQAMQRDFEVIHDLFMPTLLRQFARTNKVLLARSLDCYKTIITNAKVPKLVPRLCSILKNCKEPNKSVRRCIADCLQTLMEVNDVPDIQKHTSDIEAAIQTAAMDPAPEVRLAIRSCYKTYCEKLPEQSSKYNAELPADVKKYLSIQATPSPSSSTSSRSSNHGKLTSVPRLSKPSTPTKSTSTARHIARLSAPVRPVSRIPIKPPVKTGPNRVKARKPVTVSGLPIRSKRKITERANNDPDLQGQSKRSESNENDFPTEANVTKKHKSS